MNRARIICAVLLAIPLIVFGGNYFVHVFDLPPGGASPGETLLQSMRDGGLMHAIAARLAGGALLMSSTAKKIVWVVALLALAGGGALAVRVSRDDAPAPRTTARESFTAPPPAAAETETEEPADPARWRDAPLHRRSRSSARRRRARRHHTAGNGEHPRQADGPRRPVEQNRRNPPQGSDRGCRVGGDGSRRPVLGALPRAGGLRPFRERPEHGVGRA